MSKNKPPKSKKKTVSRKKYQYAATYFASKAERDFAYNMDKEKIHWFYEPEKFDWYPPPRKYTPDFKIMRKDRSHFFVEYKGYLRPDDKVKMKAFKAQHPNVDCRFVFMNAHKPLYKGSPTTYAMWAEKHGFKWAHKVMPKEWLEETEESDAT